MENDRRNAPLFWSVIVGVVLVDIITKAIAVYALVPQRIPREVIGEYLRFTLVYNPGAAFGLHLGDKSRWIFTILTIGALYILANLYRTTRSGDWTRTLALALVCAGAIGNLIDRLRSPLGVVDFIDIGLSPELRWWTFNVADMAVSTGAFMLAWVLWGEEKAEGAQTAQTAQTAQAAQLSSKPSEI